MSIKEIRESEAYKTMRWTKEEADFYKAINQAKEAIWNARMQAIEIQKSYQSPAFEAYKMTQCAYELLETAKVLMMIHFDDQDRKAEGG